MSEFKYRNVWLKAGFKPIASEAQANILLRRHLKYLYNRQQKSNSLSVVNYDDLLAFKKGNLFRFILIKKTPQHKAYKVLLIKRIP